MRLHKSCLLFFTLLSIIVTNAQEEIHFKIGYLPGKRYEQTSSMSQVINVHFIGPPELLEKLRNSGDSTSKKVLQDMQIAAVIETGKTVGASGEFPVNFTFERLKMGEDSTTIPPGTKILGRIGAGAFPKFDTVISAQLGDDVKHQIIMLLENMFKEVTFPEKQLKKGESFTHDTPVKFPIGNLMIAMKIQTKYTFISAKNGVAFMAISQAYSVDGGKTAETISATGGGDGELVYDIANQFYTKYKLNLDLKMHIKTSKVEANEIVRSFFEQGYVITSN